MNKLTIRYEYKMKVPVNDYNEDDSFYALDSVEVTTSTGVDFRLLPTRVEDTEEVQLESCGDGNFAMLTVSGCINNVLNENEEEFTEIEITEMLSVLSKAEPFLRPELDHLETPEFKICINYGNIKLEQQS